MASGAAIREGDPTSASLVQESQRQPALRRPALERMRLVMAERAGETVVAVTLSRRNLLALLHKLDLDGSARTITQHAYRCLDGRTELVDDLLLISAALVSGLAACFALDALRYDARTDNVSFVIEMKGTRVEDALRALLIAAVLGTVAGGFLLVPT